MNRNTVRRAAVTAFAAAALTPAFIVPVGAAQADDGGYRAADDYVRSLIYWHQHPDPGLLGGSQQEPARPTSPGRDAGATAWELALSATLGAVIAGGVLVAVRQVNEHRHPVASAH